MKGLKLSSVYWSWWTFHFPASDWAWNPAVIRIGEKFSKALCWGKREEESWDGEQGHYGKASLPGKIQTTLNKIG